MPLSAAIQSLDAADLPAATVKICLCLLARIHPDTGSLTISWDEYIRLTNGTNRRAAQRHLTRLQQARLIHYSTNSLIYVVFTAWLTAPKTYIKSTEKVHYPKPAQADPMYSKSTCNNQDVLFQCLPDTVAARIRAIPPLTPPCLSVCLIDDHPETDRQVPDPDQPDPRTLALLTDPEIGIELETAARLASVHEFSWVQRQVAKWWTQVREGKSTGSGGLINRLNRKWGPGNFPEAFRKTDLYRRHWDAQPTAQSVSDAWRAYLAAPNPNGDPIDD